MAYRPGILTDWPWKPLGSFKYILLVPWAVHSYYRYVYGTEEERDASYVLIFPFIVSRIIHNLIWISFSRHRTAKGTNRIVDKPIDFEQVDREASWDDQILFNGLLFYVGYMLLPEAKNLPVWRTDGIAMTALLHVGPVEFLYYWLHRALHHHFLYSHYHSHHHSSIATEPITSVVHPFAEHIAYSALFAIPLLTTVLSRTASLASIIFYVFYIDIMNNMGHCNFEFVPSYVFNIFPLLKYLMYTPSFHSLHHTQFRTNYSLFMPFYDYLYHTVDKSSDSTYQESLKREEEFPDVVHLTHLTTPDSIYHLGIGVASIASKPFSSKWYTKALWPFTLLSVFLTHLYGGAFISERNFFKKLKFQTWVIPTFNVQYLVQWRKEVIDNLIEEVILEAERREVKVLSLGLLNQVEELNRSGESYLHKHPELKIKLVDGSNLAVAVLLNTIPKQTTQVILRGKLTKTAYSLALRLCQNGIKITTLRRDEFEQLVFILPGSCKDKVVFKQWLASSEEVWLVGKDLTQEEQSRAVKGTLFIPFSQLPPKKFRSRDCVYHTTPALVIPQSFNDIHSCENWLPRRVISAWRAAGIIHALEGWTENECGNSLGDVDKTWRAALHHGFRPFTPPFNKTSPTSVKTRII